jgi:hypothetical protein
MFLNYIFFMKKIALCFYLSIFCAAIAYSQNNLAAGDIAFVSYQSDTDPTNTFLTTVLDFDDRFSIVVLKPGGLVAGTVIYITSRGWDGPNNIWLDEAYPPFTFGIGSEAVIKWVVPAGGILQGKEVFFINKYHDELAAGSEYFQWFAYSNENGTVPLGIITNETPIVPTALPQPNGYTDGMSLYQSGGNILIYQTGPLAGAPTNYNDATRRFITAILANIRPTNVGTPTSYAAWDVAPNVANESSIPPGLVNGQTCFLMSPGPLPQLTSPVPGTVEPDNGKFSNCALSSAGTCTALQMSTLIYTITNWTYSNTVFPLGTSSSFCTYTILAPVTYGLQPSAVTACTGLSASFNVNASGGGTLTYQWQESANATFTSPTNLANTVVYSGTGTNTLTISDNTGLSGRYYRVIVTGPCGAVNSNGALLTVTSPVLSANNTITQSVNTQNNIFYAASCGAICKIVPSGGAPISGNVTTQVWVEGAVPTFSNVPFVQRHYQITPSVNAGAASATVTLYFSQAEFTAFNTHPNSTLDLPTGTADATGKANLRIVKYPGSSNNSTGLPGSYTGNPVLINPIDANIVFNSTFSRWEITFDVTGFSGFIVQTQPTVIPVKLISFAAQKINNNIIANWQTSSEINHDHFELERSIDGQKFIAVGQIPRNVNNGGQVADYSFTDTGAALLNVSLLYYRLKMVSIFGGIEYSNIIRIPLTKSTGFVTSISPNPFVDELNLNLNIPEKGQLEISISDMAGRILISDHKEVLKGYSTYFIQNLNRFSRGVYFLIVHFKGEKITYKLIK